MEQLAILNNIPSMTAEQQEAAAMHFEIVQAAKTAVNSLLDLGRKLKRMRDSGRYKDLGFGTFAEYTEAAVGIKQRQAYNYIQVVESLPARLIEENAAAGVTKLALLAKLNPEDREDLTGDTLANITVAELKKLVEERDAMAQQLTIFQQGEELETVADVEAEHLPEMEVVDIDAIRQQAEEETRQQLAAEFAEEKARLEAAHAAAVNEAVLNAEKAAAAEVRKAKADAKKKAEEETAKKVEQARKEAAQEAAAEQEAKDRAKVEQAKQAEAEARERAEAMAKQMEAGSDEEGVRFFLLFDQLTDKVTAMWELAEAMRQKGKEEQADKLMGALRGALADVLADLEGGAA